MLDSLTQEGKGLFCSINNNQIDKLHKNFIFI
jgi:hypothetical protein